MTVTTDGCGDCHLPLLVRGYSFYNAATSEAAQHQNQNDILQAAQNNAGTAVGR